MAQSIEQRLLQAIKTDDIGAYGALAETARIGEYRLGRFPVLSLMYLYKSRKLLAANEYELLRVSTYVKKNEPAEISVKFSSAAGKCLRLYCGEVVSPLEMLLILDKTKRLTKVFPNAHTTEQIKSRLQAIYSIKYALGVRFEGKSIVIDKRPLSYREKKKIITLCLCSALGVAVVVGVPTITVSLIPKPVEGEVNELSDINFSAKKEYILKSDITLNESVDVVNCTIKGNGHKLILRDGAALGTLNGKLTGMTIECSGGAVFYTVSSGASVTGVTVNVDADYEYNQSAALVATVNYGKLDGVTVNVHGSLAATESADGSVTELAFGGIVQNNSYTFNTQTEAYDFGVIKNCTVNYSQFDLTGATGANASFGGVVAVNNGYVLDCTVSGDINADTFDVGGVCYVNYGEISGCVNGADIIQRSSESEWNPIACGIVINNAYSVENCRNTGKISVASTGEKSESEDNEHTAVATGIAYINRNADLVTYIKNCENTGDVESYAVNGNAYAAGICTSSSGGIERCGNFGAIKAIADNGYQTCVGGIADYAYGYIYKSSNGGDLSASGRGTAYAGGISAYARAQFLYCASSGEITVTAKSVCAGGIFGVSEVDNYGRGTAEFCISENRLDVTVTDGGAAYVGGIAGIVSEQQFSSSGGVAYHGGGVTDSCFIGECVKQNVYFGNIVGACGFNIYTNNLYYSNGVGYPYFDGNYYADNNAFKAFGAALSSDGLVPNVADKGAVYLSVEQVKNTETYKTIVSELEKE